MKQRRRPRMAARKAAQQKNRMIIIGGAVLAALLIVFLGYYLKMNSVVNKVPKDVICEHVFIDTVNVSGMNEKEAKAAIEEKLSEYKAMKLTLIADEAKFDATLGELGFEMKDTEKLVKEALSYGKEGGVWKRYSVIKELSADNPVSIETVYRVDVKEVEKVVEKEVIKEVPVEVPAEGSNLVWIILLIISIVINVALAVLVVLYFIKKKNNQKDNTPLVDYNIEEDDNK